MARRRTALRRATVLALTLAGCAGLPEAEQALKSFLQPEVLLVFDDPSDLLPPENLHVTSNEDRQISLSWEPVLIGDVAGYVVLRAPTPQGPYQKLGTTSSRFGSVFRDTGEAPGSLGDGKTYFYRIRAYDSRGRVSSRHAYVVATTEARPPMPTDLHVYSNIPRAVALDWEPSEQRSVWGYAVYRCPTTAGPWERVAYVENRLNTVYVDGVPGDLRVLYYRISALNRFGGESDRTEAIRAVTKAEPLPPIGVAVADRLLGEVRLVWEANVEPDLVGYEIWRSRRDGDAWGERELLARVWADDESFRDDAVGCGERVRYELRAYDADGLISQLSRPLEVTGQDIGLRLERDPTSGAWELHWDAARTAAWPAVRIDQIRRGLRDRAFGNVTGGGRFAFPKGFRPSGQLVVSPLTAAELEKAPRKIEVPSQLSCRIAAPRKGAAATR